MGKPATQIVVKGFEGDAKFNARAEGLADLALTVLPEASVAMPGEIRETRLGEKVADRIIAALTQELPSPPVVKEREEQTLAFSGGSNTEASENMEKHFLQNCWSDGLPLIPPTREAVDRMLEGTELPPEHLVGLVEPGRGRATVEKIAINAVIAGCLPQYMPVVLAAVEAITDSRFDLRGVQCTAGMVSPLLVVSGPQLIRQLNINDSFSTMGPGWRANATIGRAIRLVMINIGYGWPGKNDMKAFGSPFKHVTLMAENEGAYGGAWEPIRVVEGFDYEQPTVSVFPAVTWQLDVAQPTVTTVDRLVWLLTRLGKTKYDMTADTWGMDNLVLISPTFFEAVRKAGVSRSELQKRLYDGIQLPCHEFFGEKEPSTQTLSPIPIPEWLVKKCRLDRNALAPLLFGPESIKIIAAGAPGPPMCGYIGTWGYGPAYFVTKPIKVPPDWEDLLVKYQGWETGEYIM